MKKRILLLFLSAAMMLSNLATPIFAANNDDKREVYLHAQDNPDLTAPSGGEAYLGQNVNVYLAVDTPNKGDTKLNGYFVKLYYDSNYIKPINVSYDGGKHPLNYKLPDVNGGYMVAPNAVEAAKNNFSGPDISGTETVDGITYNVISALVFFSGFELENDDSLNWYNILGVTFEAQQEGTTEVFIDTMDFDEADNGFELFAKHEAGGKKYFTTNIRNGGHYLLNIKSISRPPAPQINMASGSYTPNDLAAGTITITAQSGCDIWYTTKPNAPDYLDTNAILTTGSDPYYTRVSGNSFVYPNPIDETTTLKAIATRTSNDGDTMRYSYVTKREYRIVPHSPSLFLVGNTDDSGKVVASSAMRIDPPYHNSPTPFEICIDDGYDYDGELDTLNEIYYTFSLADVTDVLNYDATTPKNDKEEWVQLLPSELKYPIEITENCNIRIVTKRKTELSGVTEYLLSISPEPALVKEDSQKPQSPQSSVDVELVSATSGAEIFYTLDGSDPRIQGGSRTQFKEGDVIPVQKSLILTTVAYYDGVYSELTTYEYDFGIPGSLWVDASHQSGDYDGEIEVHLISANIDDEIYYTTDGNEPTDSSSKYDRTKPIEITEDSVIKAVAKDKEGNYSEVKTFFYYIKPKAPEFRPQTTQFSENGEVHIHSDYAESGYELWITTDGTDPREQTQNTIKVVGNFHAVKDIDDYTVIKAVVAKTSGTEVVFSDLVMHTYDVVTSRPSKPTPTLVPGTYTITPENSGYSTKFVYPGDNIKIYYTVATSEESPYPPNDPVGSKLWEGEPIPIKGETIIKAVAEDIFGRRSQIGLYYYKIIPEAPTAPTSANYTEMDFIPVTAVEGSEITYTINGVTHTIPASNMEDRTTFYIDSKTGEAFTGTDRQTRIDSGDVQNIAAPITLELSCEKDGVSSNTSTYHYNIGETPAPPFVSKNPGGEYPQKVQTANGAYVKVELDTLEKDGEIWYCTDSENISDESAWTKYDPETGIEIFDDTTLHARVKKGDNTYSNMITEVYTFKPLPPVVTPDSGTYSGEQEVTIKFDENASSPDGS
ncbi:MAG: chitobiase/beta-hexosaminidase C-terminal domain-containing protein, partial [Clostridia bacterium]|nr:chitobiase/beta-hexosaminidase C-terminal domain-containing protein [Clostridia bacterium]